MFEVWVFFILLALIFQLDSIKKQLTRIADAIEEKKQGGEDDDRK